MRAMRLESLGPVEPGGEPLALVELPTPSPAAGELLLKVRICGVCHTELDEIEGRTAPPSLPVVPGHQVVGEVVALGQDVTEWRLGERAGVAWIFSACGTCPYCHSDRENLCACFEATGRDHDGGYAEFMNVPAAFAYRVPETLRDEHAAPLLCAGAIGYRSLRLTNLRNGSPLGLTGFGASAHLVLQMVRHRFPDSLVFVFARELAQRSFALELGAAWAGDTLERAPVQLDAIIDTTPAWTPVVEGLKSLAPGGRLVINAIRKEDGDKAALQTLDYGSQLWLERELKSVANVTRRDVVETLRLAAEMQLQPKIQEYALSEANQALIDLKTKSGTGAKVLVVQD